MKKSRFTEAQMVTILREAERRPVPEDAKQHGVSAQTIYSSAAYSWDLRGHITPGSIYAYVDQALGAWDQRPIFKTNVTQFTSLRRVPPEVPLETLRKLVQYFPSPQEEHALSPSYEDTEARCDPERVKVFKDLQKMEGVGLVVPVGEEHMYYAAMNSTACKLTALGAQYWRLAKESCSCLLLRRTVPEHSHVTAHLTHQASYGAESLGPTRRIGTGAAFVFPDPERFDLRQERQRALHPEGCRAPDSVPPDSLSSPAGTARFRSGSYEPRALLCLAISW